MVIAAVYAPSMLIRAFIRRTYHRCRRHPTLRSLKSLLDSLLLSRLTMALEEVLATPNESSLPSSDPPPFDPNKPAIPISYPLETLEELESESYYDSFHFDFNISRVKLPSAPLPQRPRILVCHDMLGGYLDDKWVQGGSNADAYSIWHWNLMDVFVYFSHHLVTLPPPCWINTAHKHGVKVLGTFILENNEGRLVANKLLATRESAQMYAKRLSKLAERLGFDGWLLNFEVKLDIGQILNLKEFVSHLTETIHSSLPASLVIWYDSVTVDGELDWQNKLNINNKPFFDLCDGIFVNYTWKESYPRQSALVAGDRRLDVYMGIDVFGRNTFGDGQWKTNVALDVIKKDDVSAAIFAPGWVYETKQPPDFYTAQNQWWGLVEQSWGISQKYPRILPFYSNFDQGRGYHISADGGQILDATWNNISCQSFQPCLKFFGDSTLADIQVSVNFNEASYSGGGNITFKGELDHDAYFTARLFQAELVFGDSPVYFRYSVRSDGSSLIRLALEFMSAAGEKRSVLLASLGDNRFFSHFSSVVMLQVTKLEEAPGWVLQESEAVMMDGYTLTEIRAVGYMGNFFDGEHQPPSLGQSEYAAVLGHLNIYTAPPQHSDWPPCLPVVTNFPPSTSWDVEGKYIKWCWGSQGSKKLSMKLTWRLKDGNNKALFPKYNIYVQKLVDPKLSNGMSMEKPEYIGVAEVEAFYISDLVVSCIASNLKFIIQVCDPDNGASQKLEDSPFFDLKVQSSSS